MSRIHINRVLGVQIDPIEYHPTCKLYKRPIIISTASGEDLELMLVASNESSLRYLTVQDDEFDNDQEEGAATAAYVNQ